MKRIETTNKITLDICIANSHWLISPLCTALRLGEPHGHSLVIRWVEPEPAKPTPSDLPHTSGVYHLESWDTREGDNMENKPAKWWLLSRLQLIDCPLRQPQQMRPPNTLKLELERNPRNRHPLSPPCHPVASVWFSIFIFVPLYLHQFFIQSSAKDSCHLGK